jgi:hypothetical protein
MKQLILSLLMISGLNLALSAQAYEGTAEYDKKKQQVFMIDYPYPPEAVENAVIKKMSKLGYKSKRKKGYSIKTKATAILKMRLSPRSAPIRWTILLKWSPKVKNQKLPWYT